MSIQKEKSDNELYAENWLEQNGFAHTVKKQYISKTNYQVSKDGITDSFELPSVVTDIKIYMEQFNKSFEMKREILQMKMELKK